MCRRRATGLSILIALAAAGCASSPKPTSPSPAGPGQAKAPVIVKGQRLGDPDDPRFKPVVPQQYQVKGKSYVGLFKVCVSAEGSVNAVTTTGSTGIPDLDDTWSKIITSWRYRPYSIDGRPVPYCHPLRLEVKVDPARVPPKLLPPGVGASLRLANVATDPRYRPRVPKDPSAPGQRYWALYKVCVTDAGQVSHVGVIKPVGVPEIDQEWTRLIWTWPHRPYRINGQPVDYCYPTRIEVIAD